MTGFDDLRQFLEDCKHSEHVITKTIFNAKPEVHTKPKNK